MRNKDQKGEDEMNVTLQRPCTPTESLKQSLKEMKLMREGKLNKPSWKDLKKELEEDSE